MSRLEAEAKWKYTLPGSERGTNMGRYTRTQTQQLHKHGKPVYGEALGSRGLAFREAFQATSLEVLQVPALVERTFMGFC